MGQAKGAPDVLVCYKGVFVALETKVPGKFPTELQAYYLKMIKESGGYALSPTLVVEVEQVLDRIDARLVALGVPDGLF